MKKKYLLVLFFLGSVLNISAQLKLDSIGNVRLSQSLAIGTIPDAQVGLNLFHLNQQASYCGIKSHIKTFSVMPTGSIFGVYGFADASLTANNYPISPII